MFQPDSDYPLLYDASTEISVIFDCLERIGDNKIVRPENAGYFCDQLGRLIRHAVTLSNRMQSKFLDQMAEEAQRRLENQGEK